MCAGSIIKSSSHCSNIMHNTYRLRSYRYFGMHREGWSGGNLAKKTPRIVQSRRHPRNTQLHRGIPLTHWERQVMWVVRRIIKRKKEHQTPSGTSRTSTIAPVFSETSRRDASRQGADWGLIPSNLTEFFFIVLNKGTTFIFGVRRKFLSEGEKL